MLKKLNQYKILILSLVIVTLFASVANNTNTIPTQAATKSCPKPDSIMMAIDISDSMLNSFPPYASREDAAKQITEDFVNSVNFSQDQMGLVLFADKSTLSAPMGSSKSSILSKISGYSSQHGTNLDYALLTAYNALPKTSATNRYIVLPTDGKHSSNGGRTAAKKDAATLIAADTIKKAGVIIVTVGIADGDSVLLDKVATSGYSYFAKSGSEMKAFFNLIKDQILCSVPTATPKASGTPKPSGTAKPTATPKPTPGLECPLGSLCTDKKIGSYVLNVLTEQPTISLGTTPYVKLTVRGHSGYVPGILLVHEVINSTYFDLLTPKTKLEIYQKGVSGAITNTVCNAGSCISNDTLSQMDIKIPNIPETTEYYLYFPVRPKSGSAGADIDVDSNTSYIKYPQLASDITIDNTKVEITGSSAAYFQAFGGDTYSSASSDQAIKSLLPAGEYFTAEENQLVIYNGTGSNFGAGEPNSDHREIPLYQIKPSTDLSYSGLYNLYKTGITKIDINGINDFKKADPGKPDYFPIYVESKDNDLTIGGGGWDNKEIKGQNIVVFVPGNLYITKGGGSSYTVAKDGKSSITFIVNGRVGIDPAVTNVQGIFIVDDVFDTACSLPADSVCSPNLDDPGTSNPLTLEGFFYSSLGGFKLDRQSTSATTPGETFTARQDMIFGTLLSVGKNQFSWKEEKD